MNTFLSIVVSFICLPWQALIMMSPMMIAAPDFSNKKSSILTAMIFFSYPGIIFILLYVSGYSFYGTDPFWWSVATGASGILVSIFYGLPLQFLNLYLGIANYDYFIKGRNAYLNGKRIKGADTNTFTHFNKRGYYSKDALHVYYNTGRLKNADAPTFQPVANDDTKNYWHDKNNVYYKWSRIADADGASFVYAGNFYGYDKNHVYFENQLIKEADRNTFIVLFGNCGRDVKNVFVREIRATNIKDPNTFEMIFIRDEQFGKDKYQIYVLRHTPPHPLLPFPGADLETFDVLGEYYAKDKNNVYYYSYIANDILVLEGADPKKFTLHSDPIGHIDATDGERYYKAGLLQ